MGMAKDSKNAHPVFRPAVLAGLHNKTLNTKHTLDLRCGRINPSNGVAFTCGSGLESSATGDALPTPRGWGWTTARIATDIRRYRSFLRLARASDASQNRTRPIQAFKQLWPALGLQGLWRRIGGAARTGVR